MTNYRLRSDLLLKTASAHGDRSCYAIAKRTGIAESTLSRLRRGVAKPAAETLLVLAQAYGLSIDELIDRDAEREAVGNGDGAGGPAPTPLAERTTESTGK